MLDKLIGSKSRAEILKRLFTPKNPSIYLRRLAREAGFSAPVVHRELRTLLELGLVRQNSDGNRINFSANCEHPFFAPLCELVSRDQNHENGENGGAE